MQSCCYMQSSTQSVGLKNGFFFRTTHFPSHFWLSFAAGHQPLGGLLDPCRDQTSFHGGGKWWGSWGLGTQNFLDSGRWNLLWEEWWITPLKNRFRYQDISRYLKIPPLVKHPMFLDVPAPRSAFWRAAQEPQFSVRDVSANGTGIQRPGGAGWMLGPSCNRERNRCRNNDQLGFWGYFTVIMNQLWPTGIKNNTPLQ